MGFLDGKVALITGAARGQGRAHAITSAREGARVILVDIADQMKTVPYTMATDKDMAETVREVETLGGLALSITADVRSQAELDDAVSAVSPNSVRSTSSSPMLASGQPARFGS